MPVHVARETLGNVSLIDGSVLVNKPFAGAIEALQGRPAQREVDRRFVYVDPRPDRYAEDRGQERTGRLLSAIFGSLSTLPREQPIRDNLEQLEEQSREAERLIRIVARCDPRWTARWKSCSGARCSSIGPTPARLKNWRQKAQQSAAERAGYAFHAYAQAKFTGIVGRLARLTNDRGAQAGDRRCGPIEAVLREELVRRGLDTLAALSGGASPQAIAFFREHDIGFRIRRLRLLARRLARDWEADPEIPDAALEQAPRRGLPHPVRSISRKKARRAGPGSAIWRRACCSDPGTLLDMIEAQRLLPDLDERGGDAGRTRWKRCPRT